MDALSDQELVDRAQNAPSGDTRAFEGLVTRHQERVLANCRYLSGSADDAHDLAQEVFVKAFFALPGFEGRSQFGTWVQRIKINHCLNHIRKRNRHRHVDIQDPGVKTREETHLAPAAEKTMESEDEADRIRIVLDALPETLRVPLIMRDLDGLAYQEIAERLEIGLSAVKMRIKRAREAFRAHYRRMETGE